MTTPVVEMIDIGRTFPGPPEVEALRNVNLTVAPGDYVSIVGPSGSGKSTLLHLVGLLDRPTLGIYRLDGVDVADLRDRDRARLRASRIGFVFQSFQLLAQRSVLENVMLAAMYCGLPRAERAHHATAALDQVGLGHRTRFSPSTLSGGERQRVAIARALVTNPTLLLADEPTGNLDSATTGSLLELLDQLHNGGLTLAVITHDEIVSRRAQRRVQVTDGRLEDGA